MERNRKFDSALKAKVAVEALKLLEIFSDKTK
jgi:hypothetical protein